MSEREFSFSGKVTRCIYSSENFKVYAFEIDTVKYPFIKLNKYGNVSIIGDFASLSMACEYQITAIEETTKNGVSYRVVNIRRDEPQNASDTILFLSEILTQTQAETLYAIYPDIVQRVKENRLDDIDLNKTKGIKEYTFNVIKRKIIENFCLADLVAEFGGYFNMSIIKKLYQKYASVETIKEKLRSNPYKCLCGLAGVGFKTADAMLLELQSEKKNGKKPPIEFDFDLKTSVERCIAFILFALEENEQEGHTQMNLAELRKQVLDTVPECSEHFIQAMKSEYIFYSKRQMIVAKKNTYEMEKAIAEQIRFNIENKDMIWDVDYEKYRIVDNIPLSDEQMNGLVNLCKHQISIVNGAAGTGKSYSTQAIISLMEDNKKSYLLLSPTGKAAKVLASYTNRRASTIHRGLAYNPGREGTPWTFNENNKLYVDVVLVDEFSMVDVALFKHLIDAIDFNTTKLLMIGDNAQLCSVGCGNLLHDFMESNLIPTTTLTKVFRYGEGGLMKIATDVRFCKKYLDANMANKMTTFGDNKDYTFVDLPSESIPHQAVALYKKLLDKGYGIHDIQVLTAKNVGECGTEVLNGMLQKVANPNYGSDLYMKYGNTFYYKGDLVIQKQNNYRAKLYQPDSNSSEQDTAFVANGETGLIKDIHYDSIVIDFDGVLVEYRKEDLASVSLGYSITIHKSQGSSINAVILLTPKSHVFMMNANLLYVGLTRMKKVCYHLGSLSSVNLATTKKANLSRNTMMQTFLLSSEDMSIDEMDDFPPDEDLPW